MITNNYQTGTSTPVLLAATPLAAPEPYQDPTKQPDKWDLAEALIELLDDRNVNGIGKVFACYNDPQSADIYLETFPLYNDDMEGTNFRISITRTRK